MEYKMFNKQIFDTYRERFSGLRILVADDLEDLRWLLKAILEYFSIEVELANDGYEALEKAKGRDFDFIFMDRQMPNLGGLETASILRERGVQTPIIIFTADISDSERSESMALGNINWLPKPYESSKIAILIERHLNRHISQVS